MPFKIARGRSDLARNGRGQGAPQAAFRRNDPIWMRLLGRLVGVTFAEAVKQPPPGSIGSDCTGIPPGAYARRAWRTLRGDKVLFASELADAECV